MIQFIRLVSKGSNLYNLTSLTSINNLDYDSIIIDLCCEFCKMTINSIVSKLYKLTTYSQVLEI